MLYLVCGWVGVVDVVYLLAFCVVFCVGVGICVCLLIGCLLCCVCFCLLVFDLIVLYNWFSCCELYVFCLRFGG